MQETQVWPLGSEDPLKETAMHSSILAWRIPWTEEPGGLQSMGLQRVRHDWVINTFFFKLLKKWPKVAYLVNSYCANTYIHTCVHKAFSGETLLWKKNRIYGTKPSCKCFLMRSNNFQSCPTLYDTMDHSPLGSSVHRILQARILEWVAMPPSRGSSWPSAWTCNSLCLLHWQVGSLPVVQPEKPLLQTRECVKQNTLEWSRSNQVFCRKMCRNIFYWTSQIC